MISENIYNFKLFIIYSKNVKLKIYLDFPRSMF